MNLRRPMLILTTAALAAFAGPASGNHNGYVSGYFQLVLADAKSSTGGVFVAAGDVNQGVWTLTGILRHEAAVAVLTCLEVVEERDGSATAHARYEDLAKSKGFYVKLTGLRDGTTRAMGGIADRASSTGQCGAAGTPASQEFVVVWTSPPD